MVLARFAASRSPSVAETIDPFIRMCHERAKESVSLRPASSARRRTTDRMFSRCWIAASPAGCSGPTSSNEGAGLEVVAAEPVVERVEDGEQLLLRGRAAAFGLGLDPIERPELLASLEKSDHQIVLRGVVPVEGGFCHPGALDHLVDPDVSDAAA